MQTKQLVLITGVGKETGIGFETARQLADGGRPVSEGAKSIVLAATLPKGGPTGKFFKDGKIIGW
jgi:NAD(P)-dependent dehydrogenase (short-subunit alcohol dehydrogenase family)